MKEQLIKIEEALLFAKNKNIKIIRSGSVFDWTKIENNVRVKSEVPTTCNWIGAVLLLNNKENLVNNDGFSNDWLDIFCNILDINYWWRYRFSMGFNVGYQIITSVKNKDEIKDIPDYLCKAAIKLAKKYADYV